MDKEKLINEYNKAVQNYNYYKKMVLEKEKMGYRIKTVDIEILDELKGIKEELRREYKKLPLTRRLKNI